MMICLNSTDHVAPLTVGEWVAPFVLDEFVWPRIIEEERCDCLGDRPNSCMVCTGSPFC